MTSTSSSYRKKLYTKFGDLGETSLLYGGRISKNDLHTEAYGITDEAVSAMGLGRATTGDQRVKDILGIPDHVETVMLTPLGYPRGSFGPVQRRPSSEVTSYNRYGNRQ